LRAKYSRTEKQTEGGLTTGLRSVEERTDEEAERHRRETEHEQVAQHHAEVAVVEQATGTDDRQDERQQETQDDSLRDEVTQPVRDVRESHHAHGLLEAAALLEHNLHHNALDVDPKSEGNEEFLKATGSDKFEDSVEEEHEHEEEDSRKDDLQQVPLGLR